MGASMGCEVEDVLSVHNEIGGAPLWVPEEQRLYWADTEASMVWCYTPKSGAKESWTLRLPVTAIACRDGGGFLLVTKSGLAVWQRETNTCELVANPLGGSKSLRFQDGAVDRQGRLVSGTMNHRSPSSPDGCLYRLDPDRRISCLDSGLAAANGIGFSPDGASVYVSEQLRGRILRYDYHTASGTLGGRRVFAQLPEAQGLPDGIAVDREGFVWNGHRGGGRITRYDPDGKIDLQIRMPVPVVTCMAFAGDRLSDLYVTTGWYGLTLAEQKKNPGCGDLFRIRAGFTGMVEPKFRG